MVLIKESSEILFEVATQIFVHSRNRPHLFAMIASAMEQLDLSIQDARLYNSDTGFIFYTFFVLDASGKPIADDAVRRNTSRTFCASSCARPISTRRSCANAHRVNCVCSRCRPSRC